jgi:integrase
MALFKRKRSRLWWVRITVRGREIRRSTGTTDKTLAQEFEVKLKAELWRTSKLGERPRHRWEEAVERWLNERLHLPSIDDYKMHLRWLHRHFYARFLDEISRDRLDEVARVRKAEGVANSTVNRLLEVARAVLRCAAREWGWLDSAPAVRMLPEPKRRIRWITREKADQLLAALPNHLAEIARFSLATGLRKGNVIGLEWSQVDLERRVAWFHHDQTKNKKALSVPLNAEAILVLRRHCGKHPRYVFTYRKKPVKETNTKAWKRALRSCGIADFRWHDLRHTWASWHVQSGTPLQVLQELGGWSCYEMVLRYAHLSAQHLADYAENLCRMHAVTGTLSGTPRLKVVKEGS